MKSIWSHWVSRGGRVNPNCLKSFCVSVHDYIPIEWIIYLAIFIAVYFCRTSYWLLCCETPRRYSAKTSPLTRSGCTWSSSDPTSAPSSYLRSPLTLIIGIQNSTGGSGSLHLCPLPGPLGDGDSLTSSSSCGCTTHVDDAAEPP